MAALEIAAEATEVTVEGTAASIGVTVAGGTNRSTPVISLRLSLIHI